MQYPGQIVRGSKKAQETDEPSKGIGSKVRLLFFGGSHCIAPAREKAREQLQLVHVVLPPLFQRDFRLLEPRTEQGYIRPLQRNLMFPSFEFPVGILVRIYPQKQQQFNRKTTLKTYYYKVN